MLLTQEHYDLMAMFEREHSGRFDKEDKALWPKGIVYQDGQINELFKAYRRGYALSKAIHQQATSLPDEAMAGEQEID